MSLQTEYQKMIDTVCLSETYPHKHFQAANEIIVKMANAGHDPSLLSEILYEITEGYKSIGKMSVAKRLHKILKWQTAPIER